MTKSKIKLEIMKSNNVFSILLLLIATLTNAQDIELAKKAIDAEQYEKAKAILKTIVQSKPGNGKATFFLGNVYLKQNIEDSAKIYFQKGLTASESAKWNNIGLGQMDLNNGNAMAAQANFDLVTKDLKKKDIEEYFYIAKAYMNADKPDYKTALTYLNKAKAINPTDATIQLGLGDAFYGDKNQNESYAAYRNAFQTDASLIRAKMQLGVLLKGAKSYTEAVKAYDNVIAIDANYGPVYRELAETYYYWGNNEPKKYNEYIQKALSYYEKYMSLTDYSLTSRMRHADFLILAKDYKALEVEANKMKELDKVNPRILRYLGYSAYENGNIDTAIKSIQDFISNPNSKVIARDYMYLGLAKLRKSNNTETKTVDQLQFDAGVADIKKSVEMEITMTNDLSEVGKKFFSQKMYTEAASIFEIAITNPDSKNYNDDILYYSIAVFTINKIKDAGKGNIVALEKADKGLDLVIAKFPTYQDAYYHKARINRLLDKDDVMTKSYEEYLKVVTEKGEEEVTKNKAKFIESYNNIAASYANTDKSKAKEYFNKTLALDSTNTYATESLKTLK
jgi:cytochrome c-type biogenesis protein CcmH/NrfG